MDQPSLIGRDTELADLSAAAVAALRGRGRVLSLVGDAGIGKTRLSDALVQHLAARCNTPNAADAVPGFTVYAGNCQSYEQHTPYSALRPLLRHLFGLHSDETHDSGRLHAVCQERVNQLAPQLARFLPLLGDVLGGTLPDTPLIQWLTAAQRHDRLQELVVAIFLGAAARKPLLLRLDDLHWVDGSSLELLGRLAGAIPHAPLLLLLNYRADPPIDEPWTEQPTSMRLVLPGLSPAHRMTLLAALLGGTPPADMEPLLERTRGNPLFIEELARALIDAGILVRDPSGTWYLTAPPDQVTLPTSIEELLLARLERLNERQHELVQVSAVIGRRFEHPLIAATFSSPDVLQEQLGTLITADIIAAEQQEQDELEHGHNDRTGMPPTYTFRHTLLRDVAYAGMLDSRRRMLHQRVAESIEAFNSSHLEDQLALLAWHYLLAEAWLPAFDYNLAAGIQAQERYANHDALSFFNTAIEIFPHLPLQQECAAPETSAERSSHRLIQWIEAHTRSGEIHLLLGAYNQAQATYLETLKRVREILDGLSTTASHTHTASQLTSLLVRIHRQLAIVQERRADYESAFTWLGHGIAQATDEAHLELGRCFLLAAGIYQRQGQYTRALEWIQRGLQILERQGSREDIAHAYYTLGGTYSKLGCTQESIAATEKSLCLYEELQHIPGQADAHNNLATVLAIGAGRWEEATVHAHAALELKQLIGDVHGQAILSNNLGDLQRQVGDYQGAMNYFRVALEQFTLLGSDYGVAVLHMNMGGVSVKQGQLVEARQHLEQSRKLFEQMGTEDFLSELYCAYAELALAEQKGETALHWADESLALAQRLHARADEGSALQVRATILHLLGRQPEALRDLRQACAIFAEIDNKQARVAGLETLALLTDESREAESSLAEAQRIRETMK